MPFCEFVKTARKNYMRHCKNDVRHYLNNVRLRLNDIRHCFRHFPHAQNALPKQGRKRAVYLKIFSTLCPFNV